ncbi:hypothetical protein [Psychrobacter sp.]|uniref:hypothetical protein n=1 Tax=Psychrobacter sp. TaxID=56811 RepID=UPI002636E404|nr:hypothetical protein [uncultured Psychrobacter sp.]
MIVLLSQTKLPDSSNQVSDIVGAVQFYEKWLRRNQQYGHVIEQETHGMGFISNQKRSETISQWAYQVAVEHEDLVWLPDSAMRLRTIKPELLPRLRG